MSLNDKPKKGNSKGSIARWTRTVIGHLPRSQLARIIIGGTLVIGGMLGFLPVLGFWMIPLGLLVLSIDFPIVRRWRRKLVRRWFMKKTSNAAE